MLTLYKPSIEDLWFRAQMMGNEQTMAYNHAYGGTIPFPKEHWADWYDRWLADHDDKRFYRYVKVDDMFVGEVHVLTLCLPADHTLKLFHHLRPSAKI